MLDIDICRKCPEHWERRDWWRHGGPACQARHYFLLYGINCAYHKQPIPDECRYYAEQYVAQCVRDDIGDGPFNCSTCGHRLPFYLFRCSHCGSFQIGSIMAAIQLVCVVAICAFLVYLKTISGKAQ